MTWRVHDRAQPPLIMVAEALMPRGCLPNFCSERLENLGDAYLKYSTSLHCFFAYPKAHEGGYTPPLCAYHMILRDVLSFWLAAFVPV